MDQLQPVLRVLLVEDSESDAALIVRSLRRAGYEVVHQRVESAGELQSALQQGDWQLVLSDFNLPGFNAGAALAILQATGRDLPFIVTSGKIGEETAVQLMKAGAHDYVMKDNLARLGPAVEREIREARRREELRRADEELRSNAMRWSFALEGGGHGVWDWNIVTGEVLFSRQWRLMHDFADGELEPRIEQRERLVHPDDLPAMEAALRAHFEGRTERFVHEYRARNHDGSWTWTIDHGMVVARDEAGRPLRMICTHADISARKHAEAALKAVNEQLEARVEERTRELRQALDHLIKSEQLALLGGLVAGVMHELNTPLGNILLAGSTVRAQVGEVKEWLREGSIKRSTLEGTLVDVQRACDLVVRNALRASELVGSFKRVSVDQASARRRVFSLHAVVQDVLYALRPAFRQSDIHVELHIPAAIEMDGYPGPFEQIINNLVANSISHGFEGRQGGHIIIRGALRDDWIELEYVDDGHGIPAHQLERVFEPFYTTALGRGGSGLGLAIVHNLTEQVFKGRVMLQSDAGKGVWFLFRWPRVTPEGPAVTATP